jgi:hypothetical protein
MNFIFTFLISITLISDSVSDAFKNGNADKLATHLNTSIDLTVLETSGVYSKVQAQQILKKFFEQHKVTSYKVIHEGDKGGSNFVVGELVTSNGSFRTYYLIKKIDGKSKIQLLRIEYDE